MTCWADRRSLRPPSCCSVEVMNGGLGELRYGFWSTLRTANGRAGSAAASRSARAWSTTTTPARGWPSSPKSFPVATRTESIATRVAVNAGAVALVATTSQYGARTNRIRSCSRSTTRRTAGLCTRPADSPGLTRRHRTGDTSYPYRRSRSRRVSAASTRPWWIARGFLTA
jgi:hypothetical protein